MGWRGKQTEEDRWRILTIERADGLYLSFLLSLLVSTWGVSKPKNFSF